jgi:hypothetical protein
VNKFWWQLPGPNAFITKIIDDVRDGRNVILCLPDHLPEGLDYAIRSNLDESERSMWHGLSATDDVVPPCNQILSFFHIEGEIGIANQIESLCKKDSFIGKILWIQNLNKDSWPLWNDFILQYEQTCRSIPLIRRTVFIIPLVGEICKEAPDEDVTLSKRKWYGAVDSIDMLIFVNEMLRDKQMPRLLKKMAISVITNISLWDPVLARYFVDLDHEFIFKPTSVLEEYAKEIGWVPSSADYSAYDWHSGKINSIDGERKPHSGALIMDENHWEINKRIWSAQVGVMFPFIEGRRQEILESLRDILKVPFKTRFGDIIEDLKYLEIGHIETQIANNSFPISYELRSFIQRLREARNALSHLEPLDFKTLMDIEMSNQITRLR